MGRLPQAIRALNERGRVGNVVHALPPSLLGLGFAIAAFLSLGQFLLGSSDIIPSSCLFRPKGW